MTASPRGRSMAIVGLKGAAACIAVACSTATVTAAGASGPDLLADDYAEGQLSNQYASGDAICAPVGPVARWRAGPQLFGEFACDVSATHGRIRDRGSCRRGRSTWKALNPGQVASPADRRVAAPGHHHLAAGDSAPGPGSS